MQKYQIHTFSKKLLQRSVFPHLSEYLLWRSGQKKIKSENFAPVSINLDLTTACNFQCDHCIDSDIINKGKMLDLNYVKKLLSDWSKNGLKSVILIGGGEPTLYPYFEEVVKFLKKLSLQVGIVSNGTKMERIDKISRLLGKKDWVRLSLDAGQDATFEKIHRPRTKITLSEIMAQVKRMRQQNRKFQMGYSFLIIGENKKVKNISLVNNIKEIVLAAKLAKKNGFTYLSLKPFINPEGTRETTISGKNLQEIKKEIKKAKKLEDKNFKIVESINLLCFYDKNLKKTMQKQPEICHSQFFRAVVIPAGICNCSLWRGFANTKIINTNQKITKEYYKKFQKNRLAMVDNFKAKEICQKVNCLYAPLNCWIDDLIKNPKKQKQLKPIEDFNDYFF